jgi:hypothetical protein
MQRMRMRQGVEQERRTSFLPERLLHALVLQEIAPVGGTPAGRASTLLTMGCTGRPTGRMTAPPSGLEIGIQGTSADAQD